MNEHGEPTNRRAGADDCLMTLEEVGAYLQVPVKTALRLAPQGLRTPESSQMSTSARR